MGGNHYLQTYENLGRTVVDDKHRAKKKEKKWGGGANRQEPIRRKPSHITKQKK
jgi:hypothetical protein